MFVPKPAGTREQTAVSTWQAQAALLRTQLSAAIGDNAGSLLACFDRWSSAVACFGDCELHARALDRSRALDVFEDRRPGLISRVESRNEAGVAALEDLRHTRLPALKRELEAMALDPERVGPLLDALEAAYREDLADLEVSGTDAEKLMKGFLAIGTVVRTEGVAGLANYLDKTAADLSTARRDSDRGVRDNIPWWKWLTLVGIVGWLVAGTIVSAFVTTQDPKAAAAIYGISLGMAIAGFVCLVLFC